LKKTNLKENAMSIYPVQAATAQTNNPTSTGSSTTSTATDYTSMFMQLLATELQSQDPTQTMDPTTMVTQMVQINQLNDVAGIYSIMQGGGASASANASANASQAIDGPANAAITAAPANASQSTASVSGGN
jgi:flagellar hook assembly protein FlgD